MAKCTNCAAEIGLFDYCAVCGAAAPRSEPFHVPTVVEVRSDEAVRLHVAPMWERLAAGAIDAVVIGTYLVLIGFPAFLFFQSGPGKPLYDSPGAGAIASRVILALVVFAGPLLYGHVTEGHGGQTYGKRALRIRVVRYPSGRPIDHATAARRGLWRLVSIGVGGLGLVLAGKDPLRRTWHDVRAGTVVIDVEPARDASAPKAY